jgi:predicted RNase H-like nuclease (RuvC/YqgF family)
VTAYFEDIEERSQRHRMEVAALNEELDRLLAALKVEQEKSRNTHELREQVSRLTLALEEALGIIRARNEVRRQEMEAGL